MTIKKWHNVVAMMPPRCHTKYIDSNSAIYLSQAGGIKTLHNVVALATHDRSRGWITSGTEPTPETVHLPLTSRL